MRGLTFMAPQNARFGSGEWSRIGTERVAADSEVKQRSATCESHELPLLEGGGREEVLKRWLVRWIREKLGSARGRA